MRRVLGGVDRARARARGERFGPAGASESPEAVLEAAFANRYEVDLISEMEIVMRGAGGGEQRRLVQAVSKRVDGRSQSIGRVLEPANLRGLTVLISELADGGREMFVYLPALLRARRISGIQRLESFLGSDLTYDDFERQRAADFTVESLPDEQVAGERCAMIRAVPRSERAYSAMVLAVAADRAILEYRYFARERAAVPRDRDAARPDAQRGGSPAADVLRRAPARAQFDHRAHAAQALGQSGDRRPDLLRAHARPAAPAAADQEVARS